MVWSLTWVVRSENRTRREDHIGHNWLIDSRDSGQRLQPYNGKVSSNDQQDSCYVVLERKASCYSFKKSIKSAFLILRCSKSCKSVLLAKINKTIIDPEFLCMSFSETTVYKAAE